ncbi:MAG: DegT/DnrJ/EryC1/StrS family aminotransferase [Candidatus Sericytochromatia bacterium]
MNLNKKQTKVINVTNSYLPPIDEYIYFLRKIWDSNHLTNHGPLVKELEEKVKSYLDINHLCFVNNGTLALQIAIKALDLKKEIITTPFSYVATTSSIVWENCTPVFADIEVDTLTIDVKKIEPLINKNTEAILATHVYGNPCNIDEIERLALKYNLKVIYDGAHSFGVKFKKKALLEYGDISTLSFHATKLFHTVEGGALITKSEDIFHKISYLMNFGHKGKEDFFGIGINAKNSEFHAAMGLCNIKYITQIIESRKKITELYDHLLLNKKLYKPRLRDDTEYNYSYYPIIFENEISLLKAQENLNNNNIFPRRYFYPSLNKLNYVKKQNTPISEDISKRILCLPLYSELNKNDIKKIAEIILKSI